MYLKRAIVFIGLAAAGAIPLIALADEWEHRRQSNRYQTGRVDVDVDDDDFDIDVDGDGFDVKAGSRRYRVDLDDFDVDRLDDYDLDVDDNDRWEVSVRGEWGRGYESDRPLRYDFEPQPRRYERGHQRRGYADGEDGQDAYPRPGARWDRRYEERALRRSTSTQVPDRGVGQYYGSTTPLERYYRRNSEYFSRTAPPANRFVTGGFPRGTAFRDETGDGSIRRYERWTDTARDGWYDEDSSGTAYTYDYEIEYDLDASD